MQASSSSGLDEGLSSEDLGYELTDNKDSIDSEDILEPPSVQQVKNTISEDHTQSKEEEAAASFAILSKKFSNPDRGQSPQPIETRRHPLSASQTSKATPIGRSSSLKDPKRRSPVRRPPKALHVSTSNIGKNPLSIESRDPRIRKPGSVPKDPWRSVPSLNPSASNVDKIATNRGISLPVDASTGLDRFDGTEDRGTRFDDDEGLDHRPSRRRTSSMEDIASTDESDRFNLDSDWGTAVAGLSAYEESNTPQENTPRITLRREIRPHDEKLARKRFPKAPSLPMPTHSLYEGQDDSEVEEKANAKLEGKMDRLEAFPNSMGTGYSSVDRSFCTNAGNSSVSKTEKQRKDDKMVTSTPGHLYSPLRPKHTLRQSVRSSREDRVPLNGDDTGVLDHAIRDRERYLRKRSESGCSQGNEIDWRAEICKLTGTKVTSSDDQLLAELHKVHVSLKEFKRSKRPCFRYVHKIICENKPSDSYYLDQPSFVLRFVGDDHLRCRDVVDLDLHIERNQNLSFIVFKEYRCCEGGHRHNEDEPRASSHSCRIISEDACKALATFFRNKNIDRNILPRFCPQETLEGPYYWLYSHRKNQREGRPLSDKKLQKHLDLFMYHVERDIFPEYNVVDGQISRGIIERKYLEYILIPGETLVLQLPGESNDYIQACVLQNQPTFKKEPDGGEYVSFSISYWKFDGFFQIIQESFRMRIEFHDKKASPIQSLPAHPLKLAKSGVESMLRERGRTFWRCRFKNYVQYSGWDFNHRYFSKSTRFMVDLNTYKLLHPEKDKNRQPLEGGLGPEAMAVDEPPDDQFILCLPPSIFGFNMHEKTWTNLLVQNITPVEWNKQAFESLAVDKETKELITALVTNKVAADEATDVISGKGSGLIVLLHGSPGTGKTLTAESVAELPERPLYRVTCGDIGTTAEDVEKYIKSVLDLGKTWNCVVLLDEAEVFLQERSLQDLQRNALVSVFLRVLEYYDGILILTSNRVGTFDEAFKSRIQLSLHYEPLNEAQRRKIWENFFERLETFESKEDDVDIGNLRSSLGKLAKYKLNGRQIRNVITTARQLARHKGKPVNFEALKHVIKVSTKFDDYLKGINENLDDEELAREDRLR